MSVLAEAASRVVADWPARSARQSFWQEQPHRGKAELERLLVQLGYLHERMVDGLSTVLDRIRPEEARYRLSQMLVRHAVAVLERDRTETEIVPLPSVEAIANQLYILATNDWPVFLGLLGPVYQVVFPMEMLRRLLEEGAVERRTGADLSFLAAAADLAELRACLASMEPPPEAAIERTRAQAVLLLEMADFLYEELTAPA